MKLKTPNEPHKVCTICRDDYEETRPYGLNGAYVCLSCVMKDPALEAEAKRQFLRKLDMAESKTGIAVLTPDGPKPHNEQRRTDSNSAG